MAAVSFDPRDGPVGRVNDFPVVRPTPRPAWRLTPSRMRSSVFDRSDTLQISIILTVASWRARTSSLRTDRSASKVNVIRSRRHISSAGYHFVTTSICRLGLTSYRKTCESFFIARAAAAAEIQGKSPCVWSPRGWRDTLTTRPGRSPTATSPGRRRCGSSTSHEAWKDRHANVAAKLKGRHSMTATTAVVSLILQSYGATCPR